MQYTWRCVGREPLSCAPCANRYPFRLQNSLWVLDCCGQPYIPCASCANHSRFFDLSIMVTAAAVNSTTPTADAIMIIILLVRAASVSALSPGSFVSSGTAAALGTAVALAVGAAVGTIAVGVGAAVGWGTSSSSNSSSDENSLNKKTFSSVSPLGENEFAKAGK